MVERRSTGVPTTEKYSLPDQSKLRAYVGKIEQTAPLGFIKPEVLVDLASRIDITPSLENLPPGISHEDFEGMNWLSLLTECATQQYAEVFNQVGEKHNAPWLNKFTNNIWTPDELGHHAPFKIILMQMGVEEEVLDHEVERVQSLDYIHESGSTPAHATAFGMIQEFLTRNWYTDTKNILRDTSPEAASMVTLVESREALHTAWYRDMTALQIEENPKLITNVAEAIRRFRLPGNSLIPDLQQKANDWLPALHGGDLSKLKKELVRLTHMALNSDTKNLGRLLLEIGAKDEEWVGRVSSKVVRQGLDTFGIEAGYGILGEGVLQAAGLEGLYKDQSEVGTAGKVRSVFRNWVAKRVNNTFETQFNL